MLQPYHEIIRIDEQELWQAEHERNGALVRDVPMYYCIKRNGDVQFWPRLDPVSTMLFCIRGEK